MNYRIRDGKVIMNEVWKVKLMKLDVECHKIPTWNSTARTERNRKRDFHEGRLSYINRKCNLGQNIQFCYHCDSSVEL